MVKAVLYLFLAVIVISLLRAVIGVAGKLVAALFAPEREEPSGTPRSVGELKRDPVCGTFVPTATSIKRTVGGRVEHFCSAECSNKFKGR